MEPNTVLTWCDVADKIGLIGLLLVQIGLAWYFVFKYTKPALDHWGEWIAVMKELNKKLGE